MPNHRRFLLSPSSPQMTQKEELIVVLAILLCALICLLGLLVVSRCTWLRRHFDRLLGRPDPAAPPAPSPANRGLKKKVLGSLPVLDYEQAGKHVDCAICLTEFAAGDRIRVMPKCGHGYHVGCIDTWLKSHSSCPSCRQILVTVRCEKCGAKESPVAAGSVTNHVNSFFLP